jgi:hypothetical protein
MRVCAPATDDSSARIRAPGVARAPEGALRPTHVWRSVLQIGRGMRGAGAVLLLQGLLLACGDDGKGGGDGDAGRDASTRPASCAPIGQSVACTGAGGCAGAQVCQENGRFGLCDCGPGGGVGGDGGSGGGGTITTCGAACTTPADCGGGFCIEPIESSGEVEGLGELASELFPGGMCAQAPLAGFGTAQACDPRATGMAQGCGSCGVCIPMEFTNGVATVCREKCTPSATVSGCSRPEYTCGFSSGACVEGCSSDDECRVYAKDNDGDGFSDGLVYDSASASSCDMATRRCKVAGKAGAQAGDPCVRDDDCEADGLCLTEGAGDQELPFTGGACTKTGCKVAGLECAGEGKCIVPRSWDQPFGTMCTHECVQGTEPMAQQLGAAGHGQGCRTGYMCSWNGVADDPKGTCLPGNYNAVATNNVGATCDPTMRSADCYSPFGHGRCMTFGSQLGEASFCTVFDCGTPGLPETVCGAGNTCLELDDEFSACFKTCTSAAQCGAGLACVSLGDSQPSVCTFGCEVNSECKTGEMCARSGACIAASG